MIVNFHGPECLFWYCVFPSPDKIKYPCYDKNSACDSVNYTVQTFAVYILLLYLSIVYCIVLSGGIIV